ncbi:MAG: hypothetical protein K0Q72_79 [Armatimonadetes bacterium]|jgi:Uma2 family endonuclease|nr:hypothetical protein [Armatimonadota bacterium]
MTFEEAALLDPDEFPGELVNGKWTAVGPRSWRDGEVAVAVGVALQIYARSHPGWTVALGNPGMKLRHDPPTLRGPDVAVIRAERRPAGRGVEGWLEGAPDLAVELVGDGPTATAVARKGLEYLAARARLVWIVDPHEELVMVLTAPNGIRILGAEETLDGGEVLSGFSCKVSEFFE